MMTLLLALALSFAPHANASGGVIADVIRLSPSTLPAKCDDGDLRTDASASNVLKQCVSNVWTGFNAAANVLTASRALVSDASGLIASSVVTSTELGYLSGVTASLCGISQTCTLTNKSIAGSEIDSGTIPAARLPLPSASTLGGVESIAAVSHNFLTAISTSGVPALSQPAFTDISGTCTVAQGCVALTTAAVGDIIYGSATNTWSKLIGNITTTKQFLSSTGTGSAGQAPAWGQPAMTDISGTLAINAGGTGQTSQTAAFDALSPLTTAGDMLTYASGHNARVGTVLGDLGKFWASGGGSVPNSWSNDGEFLTNLNASNVTSGTLPIANGGTNNGSLAVTAGGVLYTDGSKLVNVGAGTAGQALKSNGSSAPTWGTVASTGSVNFISNPDAETDTAGYATYSNTAQALPVTGTGGSPTVTWTRTTSTPLTGTGSFLFTKDAANRQGQGASYDFVVDNASAAKVMSIDFDYEVASGTFVAGASGVDSDIEVYVYDISNGAPVIQPSGPSTYKLFSNSSTIPTHFTTTFQTASNSTSYRLIFHVATTSASAYTVKFDSISVAPSKYVYGSPITDPVAFTPTGSWSTNTTYTGFKSQSGAFGIYDILVALAGAPNSATLTVNLPSGQVIDTTKLTKSGAGAIAIDNFDCTLISAGVAYACHVVYNNTTSVEVYAESISTFTGTVYERYAGPVTQAIPGTFASGDYIRLNFRVPILGWSSSVQTSDNASQRDLAAALTGAQIPTGTLNSSFNVAKFGTITKDSSGSYDSSTGLFTTNISGWFFASGQLEVTWASAAVASSIQCGIGVNGTIKTQMSAVSQATAVLRLTVPCFGLVYVNASDTIGIYSKTDTTTPTFTANLTGSDFQVFRLGGNQTITATDTVAARYHGSSSTPGTTASPAAITFSTADYDTTGICTGGATCTLQISGKYRVTACLFQTAATTAASNGAVIDIFKNGSAYAFGETYFVSSTAKPVSNCISDEFTGIAGDTITFKAGNDGTTPSISASNLANYFTIERINGAGG